MLTVPSVHGLLHLGTALGFTASTARGIKRRWMHTGHSLKSMVSTSTWQAMCMPTAAIFQRLEVATFLLWSQVQVGVKRVSRVGRDLKVWRMTVSNISLMATFSRLEPLMHLGRHSHGKPSTQKPGKFSTHSR